MVTIGTRIAMAPEDQLSPSMSIFEDKDQTSLFKVLSDDVKGKAYFERKEANTRVNESVTKIQEEKCVVEGEENSTSLTIVFQPKLDKVCSLRDSAVLHIIQRVAKYANDGRDTAKGAVEAWRTANTKILQDKAKTRCVGKCRDLWKQLEKQKAQVTSIREENTHYMNNLTKEDQGKGTMRCPTRRIIEEEEDELNNVGRYGAGNAINKTAHRFSGLATEGTFDDLEENENKSCQEKTAITSKEDKQEGSSRAPAGNEEAECKDADTADHLIEVKCPYGSPLTIQTECESSDGEDTLGSADVLTDNEINALSMSDDICAVQRSTIDFAFAIIDCDVVLVDITLMQSLILVAEKVINGKVFKVPVLRPSLKRGESTRSISSHIAKVSAKVSKRASKKMNAIQRAIAKVDKHRQRQRLITSQ